MKLGRHTVQLTVCDIANSKFDTLHEHDVRVEFSDRSTCCSFTPPSHADVLALVLSCDETGRGAEVKRVDWTLETFEGVCTGELNGSVKRYVWGAMAARAGYPATVLHLWPSAGDPSSREPITLTLRDGDRDGAVLAKFRFTAQGEDDGKEARAIVTATAPPPSSTAKEVMATWITFTAPGRPTSAPSTPHQRAVKADEDGTDCGLTDKKSLLSSPHSFVLQRKARAELRATAARIDELEAEYDQLPARREKAYANALRNYERAKMRAAAEFEAAAQLNRRAYRDLQLRASQHAGEIAWLQDVVTQMTGSRDQPIELDESEHETEPQVRPSIAISETEDDYDEASQSESWSEDG